MITRLLIALTVCSLISTTNASDESHIAKEKILEIIKNNKNSQIIVRDFNSSIYSVVNIRIKSEEEHGAIKNRSTIRFGSGVLIAPNLVLTNNHVINSRDILDRTLLFMNHRMIKESITKQRDTKSFLLQANSDPDRIFHTSNKLDYTIFEISPVTGKKIRFSTGLERIEDHDSPIYILSYPLGHTLIADRKCEGIASDAYIEKYAKKYDFTPRAEMLYHLCDSYPGSSGSPIFDKKGNLLGIHRESFYQNGVADINAAVSYASIINDLKTRGMGNQDINNNINLESATENKVEWGIKSVLLRLPPGHEVITTEAIKNANINFIKRKNIQRALINGNISVDYPVYWGGLPDIIGLYNSHYGKYQYRHSMLVSTTQSNAELKGMLIDYLENEIDQFLYMDKYDREDAARGIGRILHSIQDSYSKAHTKRVDGVINDFFYYKYQDKGNHRMHDIVINPKTGDFKDSANSAITQSQRILEVAYNNKGSSKKYILLSIVRDVFRMTTDVYDVTSMSITRENDTANHVHLESAGLSDTFTMLDIGRTIKYPPDNEDPRISYPAMIRHIFRPIKCCPPSDDEI